MKDYFLHPLFVIALTFMVAIAFVGVIIGAIVMLADTADSYTARSCTDGMRMQLAKAEYEFTTTDDRAQKSAICSRVRSSFDEMKTSSLPDNLRSFVQTCHDWK